MPVFEAQLTKDSPGRKVASLIYKINDKDRSPRIINLVVQQQLTGFERLPFAYQYIEGSQQHPQPRILLVVAPGVSVLLKQFPSGYSQSLLEMPVVQIFRVQDPEIIPPLGMSLRTTRLVGSYEVNPPPPIRLASATPPDDYFQVTRMNSTVVIRHPFTNTEMIIDVPEFTPSNKSPYDYRARFAFEIDVAGVFGHADKPLLRIVKTPEVRIACADNIFMDTMKAALAGKKLGTEAWTGYWDIYEVNDINQVPPQGSPIVRQNGWRRITEVDRRKPLAETMAKTAFDCNISVIPIIGDAVDIAEFVYAVISGKDKWGRRVTVGDLILMGIGAVIPFVGAGMLRGGRTLVQKFGIKAEDASNLIKDIRNAGFSNDDIRLMQHVADTLGSGKQIPAELLAKSSDLLGRLRRSPPVAEDLLNAERSGFLHADLQELYQNYVRKQRAKGQDPSNPKKWALNQKHGRPRQILESLLGTDYVKRSRRAGSARQVNLTDVPRPDNYSDEVIVHHLDELRKRPADLYDRLGKLIRQWKTGTAMVQFLARRMVNEAYFRILKGNVAEIFSLKIQRQILGRIKAERQIRRNARIIHGVRVRLMKDGRLGKEASFSDNIVAMEYGGNLYVYAVFEVKSGYQGGQEATVQIFEWLERRLTEGSELVIPRKSKLIDVDGTERATAVARRFRYDPEAEDTGRVILLFKSERHLITAKGTGHLGMNSAMRVAPDVRRHELDVTSEQIDYITARLFQEL